LISFLNNRNRKVKRLFSILVDIFFTEIALFLSFSIRLGHWYFPENEIFWLLVISPLISIPVFASFGLYKAVIRYFGFESIWQTLKAVILYSLIWGILSFMLVIEGIPRSVIFINTFLVFAMLVGARFLYRWMVINFTSNEIFSRNKSKINILIFGAGNAGIELAAALEFSQKYRITGFIDNNQDLIGAKINGINVFEFGDVNTLIQKFAIKEVYIAIPSISKNEKKKLTLSIENQNVIVRTLPNLSELAAGRVDISDTRKVSLGDLLGRKKATVNETLLSKNISEKNVLVTGAGGSIGSELSRQISLLCPKSLVMLDMSEIALYKLDRATSGKNIFPVIGDIRNKDRLIKTIKKFEINTIYHAAAYKHVPIVEENIIEGIDNNVFGTLSIVEAAVECSVETFVLVSSDKAVRPTNIMGASKRCAEQILQAYANIQSKTIFTMVRFGNVLGSSGSVIPLFLEQISNGGPITLTDKDVIRYFMMVSEAVELVIQSGASAKGGEVFVLDMGEPVKIFDLARKMVHLSGLEILDDQNPNGDIEIKIIGLRPGEKLYEELLIGNNVTSTENELIMMAHEDFHNWQTLENLLLQLKYALQKNDSSKARDILKKIVPGFKPQLKFTQ